MAIRVRDPDTDPDTDPDPYRGTGIRRALAEVCTVPVLLVECEFVNFSVSDFSELRQGALHRVSAKNADVYVDCL